MTLCISLLLLLTGCGGGSSENSAEESPATTFSSAEEESPAAPADESSEAAEGEAEEVALPKKLNLKPTKFGAPGEATFAAEGDDQMAITVRLNVDDPQSLTSFDVFWALVLPDTCADQPKRMSSEHVESAAGEETPEFGKEADTPVVVPVGQVLESPHALVVMTAPGDTMLACGDITSP